MVTDSAKSGESQSFTSLLLDLEYDSYNDSSCSVMNVVMFMGYDIVMVKAQSPRGGLEF